VQCTSVPQLIHLVFHGVRWNSVVSRPIAFGVMEPLYCSIKASGWLCIICSGKGVGCKQNLIGIMVTLAEDGLEKHNIPGRRCFASLDMHAVYSSHLKQVTRFGW
jgi:hypothetical protein